MGIVANAKALMEQHGFDFDVAYLSAWYGSGRTDVPMASPWQVIAWMHQVKHIPVIDEETALRWLEVYGGRKGSSASASDPLVGSGPGSAPWSSLL